jgi:phosphonate transport system substrate-binding protein
VIKAFWLRGITALALVLLTPLGAVAYMPSVLRVGFAPFENQETVMRKAAPIVAGLARDLGMRVTPFVAGDYPGVVEAMRSGKLDVAFLSPAALVQAERVAGVRPVLKSIYKNRSCYYSAIITRVESPIHTLSDLKGKTFAFVDPDSTSGDIYPKVMLIKAGINPNKDFSRVIYAGGHDAAILAVLNHRVDAAATFSNDTQGNDVPWKPILGNRANQIRVIAYSSPIPNGAIAVSRNLDPALVSRIKTSFLHLGKTSTGRQELARMYLVDRFELVNTNDYAPVREAFRLVGFTLK